jgi:hypothetical protein
LSVPDTAAWCRSQRTAEKTSIIRMPRSRT